MPDFRPAEVHGPFEELFPDIFFVTGGFRISAGVTITRNMVVVRQGGELTLVNAIRLSANGERALGDLGNVAHVVRIGAFHGSDDAYYVHRFAPKLWAPAGTRHRGDIKTDEELGHETPIGGSRVFAFEQGRLPECAMLLEREGGILISCDSFQNWTTFDGCSLIAKVMLKAMGFRPALIGGPWTRAMGRAVRADFERLSSFEFQHLLPGHGTPLKHDAKAGLTTAISHRFT
jgi:hypothetical protein